MAAHDARGDLTNGPVQGHLVRLAVPMLWGILATVGFQLVDMFFISLLGTEPLAAISFTLPVTFAVFSMGIGMGVATASSVSRSLGAGKAARARRLTTHAALLALIAGSVVAAGMYVANDSMFRAMGAAEDMLPGIRGYMACWLPGSVGITVFMAINSSVRATGDTVFAATVWTLASLVNLVLAPLLVFGLLGLPRLEMFGAGLATAIADMVAFGAALYIGVHRRMFSRSIHHMKLFGDSAKRIMFIAIPVWLTSSIQPLANAVITALLARYGHEAVAAFGIAGRVEAFAFVTIMALAIGMAPIVGQNWGAGRYDRVQETLKLAFTFAVLWSGFVAVVLMIFARPIAGIFSAEPGVIKAAVLYFLIVPLTYIPGNLVQGWGSAFNAVGMPKRSLVMIAVRLIVMTIPLILVGAHLWGVPGIFGAIALTNVLTGTGFHIANKKFLRTAARAAIA